MKYLPMAWETGTQFQDESYQRPPPQNYKIPIKSKVEQSRKRSSILPYSLVSQLLKREPLGHP